MDRKAGHYLLYQPSLAAFDSSTILLRFFCKLFDNSLEFRWLLLFLLFVLVVIFVVHFFVSELFSLISLCRLTCHVSYEMKSTIDFSRFVFISSTLAQLFIFFSFWSFVLSLSFQSHSVRDPDDFFQGNSLISCVFFAFCLRFLIYVPLHPISC